MTMMTSVASDQGRQVAQPEFKVSGIVLDTPDPRELARFYSQLLGWHVRTDEPTWVTLANQRVGWPSASSSRMTTSDRRGPPTPEHQQMMMHLDIKVDHLENAGKHAVSTGAVLVDFQPQDDVRAYLDPAGQPFCLFVDG
jgi:predicted enzyme related to lactoylglutathione lyase